jgi:hypothetical protein
VNLFNMKFKFYQHKRLGFIKISSTVTLGFDLVVLHIFLFLSFSENLKQLTVISVIFKVGPIFTELQKIQSVLVTLVPWSLASISISSI